MRPSRTITAVQTPIIPVVGEWIRNFCFQVDCYLRLTYGMLDEEHANLALHRLIKGIGSLCS
jgi:hypothetical protein